MLVDPICILTLVTGGAAGALITELFRRRRSRVQRIPLIERVNRRVSPELQEFTIQRIGGSSANPQLKDVKWIQEYQFAVRNTSDKHLQNAEVQFEFPADDVQAWEGRPKLSKTPLEEVAVATVEKPWKKAFRWKIPHLPKGDSVEFTFRAVEPITSLYEAALYGIEGVVLTKVDDEPPPRRELSTLTLLQLSFYALCLGAFIALFAQWAIRGSHTSPEAFSASAKPSRTDKHTTIKLGGCNLQVTASVYQMNEGVWSRHNTIFNLGANPCEIQSEKMDLFKPVMLDAGGARITGGFSDLEPRLVDAEISIHTTNTSPITTIVSVYVAP